MIGTDKSNLLIDVLCIAAALVKIATMGNTYQPTVVRTIRTPGIVAEEREQPNLRRLPPVR